MDKNKGFSKLPKDVQNKMMKKMAEGGAVKKTGMRGGGMLKKMAEGGMAKSGMVKKTGMRGGGMLKKMSAGGKVKGKMVKKTGMRKKSIDGVARKGKTRGTNR